jgi:hypothetical protein
MYIMIVSLNMFTLANIREYTRIQQGMFWEIHVGQQLSIVHEKPDIPRAFPVYFKQLK